MNKPERLILAGLVAFIAWGAATGSSYTIQVLAMSGVWALLVLGYQFSFGHGGELNLAQGAYFGVGAYTAAILALRADLDFALALPLSMAAPAVLAALVAWPVMRLKSHYFALATLAVAQLVALVAINWQAVTGGANGLPGVPGFVVFGLAVPRGLPHLALVWSLVVVGALAARHIMRGLYGLTFTALRETPLGVGTLGIDGSSMRMTAMVLGAAYAGAAGALQVHTLRVISPEVTHFSVLIVCLAMTVIGGRVSVVGAILAAVVLTHLPEWFRGLESYYLVANGLALLAVVVLAPAGIMGMVGMVARARPAPSPTAKPIVQPDLVGARDGTLLRVENLARAYGGVRALDGVDLSLRRGEIVGVIGPNGSGKTTLVNMITGLDKPDRGRIHVGDRDVTRWPAHRIARAGIARSFQTPELAGNMSVLDAVAVGAARGQGAALGQAVRHLGDDPALARARAAARAALELVGFDGDADASCGDQPHGTRRLIELARCVTTGAALIVLDEPVAGLDDDAAAMLRVALKTLTRSGRGIVVIDHDVEFLNAVADRLVCLDRGRVIAAGAPDEVAADPLVVAAYFGIEVGVEPAGQNQ